MIPQRAIDLILEAEGIDQPSIWPGGSSGITIGYGYDLGYEKNFAADWKLILSDSEIDALRPALGLCGQKARRAAVAFHNIKITRDQALRVFLQKTLPAEERKTFAAFPGLERLNPNVQGALVSLVYNRGASMDGASRAEMRAVRDAVAAGNVPEIARQIRAMKRLWVGKGLNGLLRRRDAEADLVMQE